MRPDRPCAVGLSIARVTPETQWIFVEVETTRGCRGVGEATLPGQEAAVADAVAALAPAVLALPEVAPGRLTLAPDATLAQAAAHSALDQALWDVLAQARGIRLADALGTVRREAVPVYANINRRTRDRSPTGFAAGARAAVAAGHTAIKVAPFDEAAPGAGTAALTAGFARLAAVREAIGPARLMLDCHWRFDADTADHAIAAAAEFGITWIECPIAETPANIPAIARLRATANRRGMVLAGLETAIGIDGFAPFIQAGAYDVMMPDIKYVGSLQDVIRLSDLFERAGIGFSPHNPSGPVCHAISLAVCGVAAQVHSLETQFDETPLFGAVVGGASPRPLGGVLPVPIRAGAGIALNIDALAGISTTRWIRERVGA